jgi:hypothetical protein
MIVVNVRLAPDLLAHDQGVLKAALNVIVADERILESPEDPTGEIRAKSACTHTEVRTAGV